MSGARTETYAALDADLDLQMLHMLLGAYGADVVLVAVRGEDGLRVRSQAGIPGERLLGPVGDALLGEVLLSVDDTSSDPRFARKHMVTGSPALQSFMAVPIYGSYGQQAGAFMVAFTAPRAFSLFHQGQMQLGGQVLTAQFADITEANRARVVQHALAPSDRRPVADYDIDGCNIAAGTFTGGFVDWHHTVDGFLGFSLGESNATGIGGGIVAAAIRAAIRSAAVRTDEMRPDVSAATRRIARALADELIAADTRASLFHASLQVATGSVDYSTAGFDLSVMVRTDQQRPGMWDLFVHNRPVPPEQRPPEAISWQNGTVTLNSGDMLVVANRGARTLLASLATDATSPGELLDDVKAHITLHPAEEDVIILALRRTKG